MGEDREAIRNRRALGILGSWGAGTEEDQKLAILFFFFFLIIVTIMLDGHLK